MERNRVCAERFRRTISLDDSFPDAFVLICRQIPEDVALGLRNRETFHCFCLDSEDAKMTNCTLSHTKYSVPRLGSWHWVSVPGTSARTKGQIVLLYLCGCCCFVFFLIGFFMLLYLLEYFKCHGAVVVLQGGDVIVAECKFGPSIYLQTDRHPFTVNSNNRLHSVYVISQI